MLESYPSRVTLTTSLRQGQTREGTRIQKLLELGTDKRHAILTGISRKGYWHLSRTLATQTGMTNDWLAQQGLLSIRDLWMKAQGYD
jgi:RNA-directed DNA polymerase